MDGWMDGWTDGQLRELFATGLKCIMFADVQIIVLTICRMCSKHIVGFMFCVLSVFYCQE